MFEPQRCESSWLRRGGTESLARLEDVPSSFVEGPSLLPARGRVLGHRRLQGDAKNGDSKRNEKSGTVSPRMTNPLSCSLHSRGAGEEVSLGSRFPAPSWPGALPTEEGPNHTCSSEMHGLEQVAEPRS